ncbi:MAG: RNase adapter RapZ [Acidobacteriota bacterium]|nr:RNase adapter RapZ [Acidobacteriota bacterium]MDE3043415.1 RNase adapter RapZ [Acidobacteriota bacterium]MDE3107374.1 RNase adapter RapZ [Acidobacteriota bacterium]MDE3221989.1 RNase adapter RapZ [Acidobacteriota bacterium]
MSEVLLVTGMSGAGRSTVSAALEDLGWFVIDNLPLELVVRVSELAAAGALEFKGVAFVVGRSGRVQPDALLAVERELQQLHESAKILFLDASDEVLIHRYEGNRRRHPFPAPTLADSIKGERARLQSIRDAADVVFDTGSLNTNQLRRRIVETFSDASTGETMRVALVSFGYSYGIPRDVDLVFDCRFLPNPHWDEDLRPLTGLDEPVAEFVLNQEPAQHFLRDVSQLLEWQIPAFAAEGKSYLSIAIGCTGGRHRSVAVAEELRRRLGVDNVVFHRDVTR